MINRDYEAGEVHGNAKLSYDDVCLIRSMADYRDKRLQEIDKQIEALKAERKKLRSDISQKQLAFKFEVSIDCVSNILRGNTWVSQNNKGE